MRVERGREHHRPESHAPRSRRHRGGQSGASAHTRHHACGLGRGRRDGTGPERLAREVSFRGARLARAIHENDAGPEPPEKLNERARFPRHGRLCEHRRRCRHAGTSRWMARCVSRKETVRPGGEVCETLGFARPSPVPSPVIFAAGAVESPELWGQRIQGAERAEPPAGRFANAAEARVFLPDPEPAESHDANYGVWSTKTHGAFAASGAGNLVGWRPSATRRRVDGKTRRLRKESERTTYSVRYPHVLRAVPSRTPYETNLSRARVLSKNENARSRKRLNPRRERLVRRAFVSPHAKNAVRMVSFLKGP